jgi:choline monooxygenase
VLEALEDRETFTHDLVDFFDRVNAEDRFVVEGIYAGSRAPLARPGPRSWLEREIHDFVGYLARRLVGGSDEVGVAVRGRGAREHERGTP